MAKVNQKSRQYSCVVALTSLGTMKEIYRISILSNLVPARRLKMSTQIVENHLIVIFICDRE